MPSPDPTFYRPIGRLSFILFILTGLPGCSFLFGCYGEQGMSKDAFVRYVEDVFRLQNNMTSEIMALSDLEDATQHNAGLAMAEEHMQKMCADLNEYASREMDGLHSGLLLRRRVEKSAQDCEQAAHAVEALLGRQNPTKP